MRCCGSGPLSAQAVDPEAIVRSKFTVNDSFLLPDDEMEFSVQYAPDSKDRFVDLCKQLGRAGFTPKLVGTDKDTHLFVRKSPAQGGAVAGRKRSSIPIILGLLAVGSIVVFGVLLGGIYQQYGPSLSETSVVFLYVIAVIGVLVAHEMGHIYMARRSGESSPAPFAIPGIPGITAALPALGIVSRQREPAVNRDRFFDVIIAGPLFGLAVAMALYVAGGVFSIQSAIPLQGCATVNGTQVLCPSIVQVGLDAVAGPFGPSIAPGYSALSPLADGATVGLILTFVTLLPMVAFDGGHLSSLAWGEGPQRAMSYLCIILLFLIDAPNYWALAAVVYLLTFMSRSSEVDVLDEVSALSGRRKWIYLGALVVALLCIPLPQSFAGFPIGHVWGALG